MHVIVLVASIDILLDVLVRGGVDYDHLLL